MMTESFNISNSENGSLVEERCELSLIRVRLGERRTDGLF